MANLSEFQRQNLDLVNFNNPISMALCMCS